MMFKPLLFVPFVALALAACGPGTEGPNTPVDRTSYPDGPYGTDEGQVFAPLELVRDSGASFSFDADIYADEGKRLLLLTTAAEWCTACIEEQSQLEGFHDEYEADGLAIVVSVFEDLNFQPATPEVGANWRSTHGLTVDVVVDSDNVLGDPETGYYDPELTPMNMMVDIDTMEILRIQTGWDPGVIEGIIQARLGS